jgi:hypothetical protein
MNNKSYRLLRNNKEQGPFTADELIAKGLKPYDLIWVDGRSAAWSYPGEMAEFKNYVPNPDDYRNNLIVTKQETVARVSNTVQAAVAVNNIVQPKQKPRYKVSAAWSKIQTITTPVYNDVMVAEPKKSSASKIIDTNDIHPLNTKSLSWEQAWLDWEKEKKISAPRQQTAAAVPKKTTNEFVQTASAPVLEKKFEQSLDTLTNTYIDNLLLQKKKAKRFSFGKSSEFILPSIALIVIFSIGYWLLHDTKAAAVISSPVKQQSTAVKSNQPSGLNTAALSDKENASSQTATQQAENATSSNKPVAKIEAKEKTSARNTNFIVPATSNAAGNVTAHNKQKNATGVSDIELNKTGKENKQFESSVINNIPGDNAYNDPSNTNNGDLNAAENRPVRRRTNNANATDNLPVNNDSYTNTAKTKSASSYVKVPEYVTMSNGNGSVKVQNTCDDDLDLVVVDVQYYDASGRFRKGETLYLHNLRAGKTVTIKTPRDINSSYATAKVSLVSSDANNVYAVGDN